MRVLTAKDPLVMDCSVFILTFFVIVNVVLFVSARQPEINKACLTVGDCGKFGYFCARNRTCQCNTPYYVSNDVRDRCVGYVGAKCKYDEHCIEEAYCQNNSRCQCKDNFFLEDDGKTCSSSAQNTAYQRFLFPFTCLTTMVLTKTFIF